MDFIICWLSQNINNHHLVQHFSRLMANDKIIKKIPCHIILISTHTSDTTLSDYYVKIYNNIRPTIIVANSHHETYHVNISGIFIGRFLHYNASILRINNEFAFIATHACQFFLHFFFQL